MTCRQCEERRKAIAKAAKAASDELTRRANELARRAKEGIKRVPLMVLSRPISQQKDDTKK